MILSSSLISVLSRSRERAAERRQAFCTCEQVLEVLLQDMGRSAAADEVGVHLDSKRKLPFRPPEVDFARALRQKAIPAAEAIASRAGSSEVRPEHLYESLCDSSLLPDQIVEALGTKEEPHPSIARCMPAGGGESGELRKSLLEPIRPDDDGAGLVDRPDLVDRLLQTLMFSSVLLVGPEGSGRKSAIRLVARRLASDRLPKVLDGARLFRLDPAQLVAGTTYRGELEQRVQGILEELSSSAERRILVVEDLHLLAGNSCNGIDVASALVPHLKRERIRLIGCTTQDLLRERIEEHASLMGCLSTVPVAAAEPAEASRILDHVPSTLAAEWGLTIDSERLATCLDLCGKYLPHLALPGSAERLLRGAATELAYEAAALEQDPARAASPYWARVTAEDSQPADRRRLEDRHLLHALSRQHRIPFEHLDRGIRQRIEGVEEAFRETIFGQEHVLGVLSGTVKVALMNLSDPRRPRGRLFFLGPPGTGKSETGKLLARYLMGSEQALLRFDMSEFQEASSISTLLGSDKGLINSEEGGYLTEPLREDPRRVILFDEIEKAHPQIFHLFLQILEYGEIHDKRGRLVSFRHALCIFTSNVGCDRDRDLFGLTRSQMLDRLRGVFRDEFLDRIDAFVPFRPLSVEAKRQVAAAQLERLRHQLRSVHGIDLSWDEEALQEGAAAAGTEPGARHVLRWVASGVKPNLVDAILREGVERVRVSGLHLALEAGGVAVRAGARPQVPVG